MNAVAYYSSTGQSLSVARYLSGELDLELFEIRDLSDCCIENLVLVFPVYCQNIPYTVRKFLQSARIKNLTAIATYGRMCCGNVLYEIQQKYHDNIVAAAYIPTKHSYLDEETFSDFESLGQLIQKIKAPKRITLPKLYKNPLADLFPGLRGRLGIKILRSQSCTGCGICTENCDFGAIQRGVTNRKCIRCLKCVTNCPKKALSFKTRLPLRLYLKKEKIDETIIYT